MYSIARICGHTVNDHAESVVKNKSIPWAKALLEQRNGVWCSYPYTSDAEPDIVTAVDALMDQDRAQDKRSTFELTLRCSYSVAAIAWRALTRLAGLHPLRISPYARAAGSRDTQQFSVYPPIIHTCRREVSSACNQDAAESPPAQANHQHIQRRTADRSAVNNE
jgi:hypothetical protein